MVRAQWFTWTLWSLICHDPVMAPAIGAICSGYSGSKRSAPSIAALELPGAGGAAKSTWRRVEAGSLGMVVCFGLLGRDSLD